mmetsp:Transcript_3031/g.6072  ORF Transcript_3031/g.6072 Transcript_3031/m.6072 type:complete len:305 (-) Transcript_3031:85-999(-)
MNEAPSKANGQQGHDARDGEPNFERLVFLFFKGGFVVFVIGGTLKVTSLATKVIIVTGRVPGITKALFDGHFVQLPRVEFGVVRLGVVELAEQSSVRFALVQTGFHDKEAFTGLTDGSATIPLVSITIGLVNGIDGLDRRTITTGVVLPGMAFTHIVIFRRRHFLVKVLQVTLIDGRDFGEQLTRDFVVGIVVLIKEPHGVTRLRVVNDRKGIVPHAFAQVRSRSVNVLELRARIFVRRNHRHGSGRPQGRQSKERNLHRNYSAIVRVKRIPKFKQTERRSELWFIMLRVGGCDYNSVKRRRGW